MKRYKIAFFDLDGTLTDSALGITNSILYALDQFGIHVENRESLYKFIGPPLRDSFQRYYHFSPEQTEQAVEFYHVYFSDKGIFENQVYAGVPEMLADLKSHGVTAVVASAKPEVFVKQILQRFGLDGYFHFIGGAGQKTRTRKAEVVRYVLDALADLDKREIVMIGDREDDITGAKRNQLDTIGVLYGFGSREELQAAGADYLVETVEELHGKLIHGV